jgi:hypothetical protein
MKGPGIDCDFVAGLAVVTLAVSQMIGFRLFD